MDLGQSTMDEFLDAINPETAATAPVQITKPEQLNYYEQKVREFQAQVNAIDTAAYGLRMLLDLNITDDQRLPVLEMLSELEQKKSTIRTAAETVNAASALANSVGISLPKVNLQTLGALPLLPAGIAIAVTGALALVFSLISWMTDWINRSNTVAQMIAAAADLPPEQRARVLEAINATETAKAQSSTGLSNISNIVKYVAFAAVAYFAYQAFASTRK
jgi:hypothetical protein